TAGPLVLARDASFFVPGQYVAVAGGRAMAGQMYVRALVPAQTTHPYPIVLIPGLGQTGADFEATPDGREGWAPFFARQGYAVYVVDPPARARSADGADLYGPYSPSARVATVEQMFTASELYDLWPQARLHTQWPGDGPG